jgi:ribosomal-protein-alanine N-acetyltransferase
MIESCTHVLTLPIDGAKVRLRPFRSTDITATYLGWLNDPRVVRYSNQRFKKHTTETSLQYLSTFVGSANHLLGICERNSGCLIGTLTIYRNLHHGTADIGILLGDPNSWGRGFGMDAFRSVAVALEKSGQVRKLTAGTLALNLGMVRIMERAGFELEATRRAQELLEEQPVDVVYYSRFCRV